MFDIFIEEHVAIDGDDPEHVQWIYKHALKRAQEFHIQGITYRLTQGKYFASNNQSTNKPTD